MIMKSSINCTGLSTALTVLRIKQFLIDQKTVSPLEVCVGEACDRGLLMDSLGPQAKAVRLI